jgi:hypothetical protein
VIWSTIASNANAVAMKSANHGTTKTMIATRKKNEPRILPATLDRTGHARLEHPEQGRMAGVLVLQPAPAAGGDRCNSAEANDCGSTTERGTNPMKFQIAIPSKSPLPIFEHRDCGCKVTVLTGYLRLDACEVHRLCECSNERKQMVNLAKRECVDTKRKELRSQC